VDAWGDRHGISLEVEREARAPRYTGGGWMLTDNYLVQRAFFTFDVLRLADLLWGFKRITKHSVNFIPAGKTYAAEFRCYGGLALLAASQQKVDEALQFAGTRAPWAIIGFSDDLQKLWNKDANAFAAAVQQRRAGPPV
jgi:hypothetical protein